MPPLAEETVGVPQLSVADALPNAALIASVDGLHPSGLSFPEAVIPGTPVSTIETSLKHDISITPLVDCILRFTL